jgi:hypothetical protein
MPSRLPCTYDDLKDAFDFSEIEGRTHPRKVDLDMAIRQFYEEFTLYSDDIVWTPGLIHLYRRITQLVAMIQRSN